MKSFFSKFFIILSCISLAFLFDACDDGLDCNCPEITKAYLDFSSLIFSTDQQSVSPLDDGYAFELIPENLEFIVQKDEMRTKGFQLIAPAMACSCVEEGYLGMKFPISDFNLKSNADWSEELPAGSDLSELLKVRHYSNPTPLMSFDNWEYLFDGYSSARFLIDDVPTSSDTHQFTLTFTKTNGETIAIATENVTWE